MALKSAETLTISWYSIDNHLKDVLKKNVFFTYKHLVFKKKF